MRRALAAVVFAGATLAGGAPRAEQAPSPGAGSLPATLPVRRDTPAPAAGNGWSQGLALLFSAGAAGGWWWWRRARPRDAASRGRGRGDSTLTRLSSQALTPHASVHALEWNGEEFLLACTSQQVTLLSRRGVPGHVAGDAPGDAR